MKSEGEGGGETATFPEEGRWLERMLEILDMIPFIGLGAMAFIEISGDFVSLENFQGKLAADWLDSDK